MGGKKFLGMDREMRSAVGVSYVSWLAMLIAIVAMLSVMNSSINRKLNRIEAAIKANGVALEANLKAVEAVAAQAAANLKAVEAVAAQAADNHAALEANGAALDTMSAKIKKLISMILEFLDELDAIGGDDVEPKVETYRAR